MRGLCSTCLSHNRDVFPLETVPDQSVFGKWFHNVDLEEYKICWECKAKFSKIIKFRTQVYKAQQISLQCGVRKAPDLSNLSSLRTHFKATYDRIYKYVETNPTTPQKHTEITASSSLKDLNKKDKPKTMKFVTLKDVAKEKKSKGRKRKNEDKGNDIKKAKLEKNGAKADQNVASNNKKNSEQNAVSNDNPEPSSADLLRPELIDTSENMLEEINETKLISIHATKEKYSVFKLNEAGMLATRELAKKSANYKHREFQCDSCITGFTDKRRYEKHVRINHMTCKGLFICPICKAHFASNWNLDIHVDCHYRAYRCKLCHFVHHLRNVIDAHVAKHERESKCKNCDLVFDSKVSLSYHRGAAHGEIIPFDESVANLSNNNNLKADHSAHSGPSSLCCNVAGDLSFRAHMQRAHAYCYECDHQYASLDKFKEHLEHSKHFLFEELTYSCKQCRSKFASKDFLRQHITRAHRSEYEKNVLLCFACDKRFSEIKVLKQHYDEKHTTTRVTKAEKKVKTEDKACPCCSEKFSVRNELLEHIRTHNGEKPFQCEKCDKRFTMKAVLKKHELRQHQQE